MRRLYLATVLTLLAAPALALTPPKDLAITDLSVGDGKPAAFGDTVTVHYTGWLMDGTKFDSSEGRAALSFTLGEHRVIPGWEMGLLGMREGGERELVIPSRLAYGKGGAGKIIPPDADLKFKVALKRVKKAPFTTVDGAGLEKLLADGVTLIDIRRPDEWAKTGVIEGAELATLFNAKGQMEPGFYITVKQKVARDQPVALICRSGNRTLKASKLLAERLGYKNVYNVAGGIKAWIADGRPTVKP